MKIPSSRSLITGIAVCIVAFGAIQGVKNLDVKENPNWNLKSAEKVFEEYYKTPVYCLSHYPRKGITLRWCARTKVEFDKLKANLGTNDMVVSDSPSFPRRPVK